MLCARRETLASHHEFTPDELGGNNQAARRQPYRASARLKTGVHTVARQTRARAQVTIELEHLTLTHTRLCRPHQGCITARVHSRATKVDIPVALLCAARRRHSTAAHSCTL